MTTDLSPLPRDLTLDGQTITLRPLAPGDAEAMYAAAVESAEALRTTMPWWHDGFSLDEMRNWTNLCQTFWEQGSQYEFSMLSKRSGDYVGSCALGPINRQGMRANLSYWVRTSQTGHGIASEAARLVSQWAFQALGLQRVEIVIVASNLPSRRVALKAGATQEAILRNGLRWADRPYDAVLFSFIPEDFALMSEPTLQAQEKP